MSPVDIITSLRALGLSSVALWPVLMNWRFMVSYVPPLEHFISQNEHLVNDAIRHFVASWYGVLFGIALCALLLSYLGYTVWRSLRAIVLSKWHAKCSISSSCMVYDHVYSWVKENPNLRVGLLFRASEMTSSDLFGDSGIDFTQDGMNSVDDIRKIKGSDRSVLLEPIVDTIEFWHSGAYFWLRSRHDKMLDVYGKVVPDNYLDVYCFSWNLSTQPMKSFLNMINKQNNDDFSGHTRINVPVYSSHEWFWDLGRYRPNRPLHSVFIDRDQMDTMIAQVRCFLSSAGVRWYRQKGLPLRLGYLFSGPPGTGKSSLAFALAGHFGLPVYVLSLSLPRLTDKGVEKMFARIPFHCILLLEDVDATKSITRARRPIKNSTHKNATHNDTEDGDQEDKNTVTLSGLLNAIDGVGAAEGRILIMTTNHIETLDSALIRTGRADVIVTFTNVTKKQAADMFTNTYSGERWIPYQPGKPDVEDWTEDDIKRLADEFGHKIHDQKFSPAILQQYFKEFRVEPRKAVQEMDKWMEDPRGYRKHGLPEQRADAKRPAKKTVGTGSDVKVKVKVDKSQKDLSLWDFFDCST